MTFPVSVLRAKNTRLWLHAKGYIPLATDFKSDASAKQNFEVPPTPSESRRLELEADCGTALQLNEFAEQTGEETHSSL